MEWFKRERIPSGNWPFLNVVRQNLVTLETDYLSAVVDLTDGRGSVTISGWLNAYRQIMLRRVVDLARSSISAWNAGHCIGAIVDARALLETLSMFHSLLTRAEAAAAEKDWPKIGRLTSAYAYSTSSGPGKKTRSPEHPPRVQELVINFIRATQPGAEQFWEQICDISHPNGMPTLGHFGILVEHELRLRPSSEIEPWQFVAIYNCLYSICWFFCAMDDFEILLETIRSPYPVSTGIYASAQENSVQLA